MSFALLQKQAEIQLKKLYNQVSLPKDKLENVILSNLNNFVQNVPTLPTINT